VALASVIALAVGVGGLGIALIGAEALADTASLVLTPRADTYVRSDTPFTSYGASKRISTQAAAGQTRVAYLRFDVTLPAGATVTKASLRLYTVVSATADGVKLHAVAGNSWSEATTWVTKPAMASAVTSRAAGFAADRWIDLDVTPLVGRRGAVSLALSTPGGAGYQGFSSRESANGPRLQITTTSTETPTPGTLGADGVQAAGLRSWGKVRGGDEFNYVGAPAKAKWSVYDSAGHAGEGRRSPAAISVDGKHVKIVGDAHGTTGGMSARFERRKYGRWEVRMRTSARDPEYHPVLILWPDSQDWPCDGEVDFAEGTDDPATIRFFHHYACSDRQTSAAKTLDVTQWHNYAVEWTRGGIVGFIDGKEWFRDTDPAHQPPGPMHQTVQLDWFPDGTATHRSEMMVDWVRVYDLASS
jgi:hypothetical protein